MGFGVLRFPLTLSLVLFPFFLDFNTASDSTHYGRAGQEVPPLSARLPPAAPEMSPKRRKPLMVQEAASMLWTVGCERVVYH
jgi:hypothetical protein